MTQRVFNFSAGPAVLPEEVLQQVQRDLMALPGVGASILEISHRSQPFKEILAQAEADLRQLLGISDDYHILFLQGGSRLQFSMVPMNLLSHGQQVADYLLTGSWGRNALAEARKVGEMRVAWDGAEDGYTRLPRPDEIQHNRDAAYLHFTSNETIEGVQFAEEPPAEGVPLVCDASSDLLCRPLDVGRYGLIYACAQKNAGPAGMTIVIVRKALLDRCGDGLPGYLNYQVHAAAGSLWNTAPTFSIYVSGLVFRWLLEQGGLEAIEARNRTKAGMLYEVIDASNGFYAGHARPDCRSLMNVTFRLSDERLTERFLQQSDAQGLYALAGHRSVGGIRASIYNALPVEAVEKLRDFMREFARSEQASAATPQT